MNNLLERKEKHFNVAHTIQVGDDIASIIIERLRQLNFNNDLVELNEYLNEDVFFQLIASGFFNHFRRKMAHNDFLRFQQDNIEEVKNIFQNLFSEVKTKE